jgi:hypothetical protein
MSNDESSPERISDCADMLESLLLSEELNTGFNNWIDFFGRVWTSAITAV